MISKRILFMIVYHAKKWIKTAIGRFITEKSHELVEMEHGEVMRKLADRLYTAVIRMRKNKSA